MHKEERGIFNSKFWNLSNQKNNQEKISMLVNNGFLKNEDIDFRQLRMRCQGTIQAD